MSIIVRLTPVLQLSTLVQVVKNLKHISDRERGANVIASCIQSLFTLVGEKLSLGEGPTESTSISSRVCKRTLESHISQGPLCCIFITAETESLARPSKTQSACWISIVFRVVRLTEDPS